MTGAALIGVYVHIPYCRTLCPYCDFVRRPLAGPVPRQFIDALVHEITAFTGASEVGSVFFGGGTPSLLDPGSLGRILDTLRQRFVLHDAEITIEANPDDVTPSLVAVWKGLGINRVSLGVQSFDDRVLRYLGRRHDAAAAQRACERVAAEFDNWGMDLIFGAPPLDAWDDTLVNCVARRPRHVSAYGLTYDEGTPFGLRRHEAVNDETWLVLYRRASERLAGLDHYEISNYAVAGYECRHNLVYWRNEEYAGFGPGAYSFLEGVRSRNHTGIDAYLEAPGEKAESVHLTDREIRVETVIQRLRLKSGLGKADYTQRFGRSVRDDFGRAFDGLLARGLLHEDDESIYPTGKGFELNNEIGLALVP